MKTCLFVVYDFLIVWTFLSNIHGVTGNVHNRFEYRQWNRMALQEQFITGACGGRCHAASVPHVVR